MKLAFKPFYTTEFKRYRVVKEELKPNVRRERMCANCTQFIYNRISRGPFCAKHWTPAQYYENCAYFKPIWDIKLA